MISAYLQIYNDDDFLKESIDSIKDCVDELIVVDGCYEWMATYYSKLGLDPSRSHKKTYEILDNCSLPYTSINKVWKNQLEKRSAGYSACNNRYILRIDSDEIFHFYEDALDRFLSSDSQVAHIDMPEILTPDLLISELNNIYPKQCFLFDSKFINPNDHLHYLWLVLHVDSFQTELKDFKVFPEAIAFNSHLTNLRTIDTSINRASYYIMNWMRKNGYPSLAYPNNTEGITDFDKFFDTLVAPSDLRSIFSFSQIMMGRIEIDTKQEINPIPESLKISNLNNFEYEYRKSLGRSLLEIKQKKYISGSEMFVPAYESTNFPKLQYIGEVDQNIINIQAEIIGLSMKEPYNFKLKVHSSFNGKSFLIDYSEQFKNLNLINCAIKFTIWTSNNGCLGLITLLPQ